MDVERMVEEEISALGIANDPKINEARSAGLSFGYKMSELFRSMDFCVGQPFLLELTKKYYPTQALIDSSQNPNPRISTEWKAAIVGARVLDNQEFDKDNEPAKVIFSVPRHICSDGKNYLDTVIGGFDIALQQFNSLGKSVEETVPNAYERSYSKITSQYRLFIGKTEVKHFLIKSQGGKGAPVFLEKIISELSSDNK